MENEEENKKAGTQTATEETSTGANNDNNEKTNSDADIANAFGNKEESDTEDNSKKEDGTAGAENKTEKKGGSKANSVAKQNEDGSITFRNQEELEGFINKIYAKGATKAENNNNETDDSKSDEDAEEGQEQKNESANNASTQKEPDNTVEQVRDYTDSIALALVEADINTKRARAASRLIDTSKVIVNGALDEAKLQEEINNLISEWPELKNTTVQNQQEKGFKFGGEGQQDENMEEDQIAQIFGNKSDN